MNWASIKKALNRPVLGTRATSPRARRRERGVALLIVVGSLAILTAVTVDFRYNTSVDLQLAANARDELRAEYMARSAISMSRLLLRFQKQLDGQSMNLGPMLQALGLPGGGGGLNIRLWELVPLDCSLFGLLSGAGTSKAPTKAPAFGDKPLQSFGDFSGCFQATLQDEEQKINLNRLNAGAATGRPPMVQALALLADPRFEFVFEKDDANGVKMNAQDTLIALHDWIDERDSQASLNLTAAGDPFPDAFGDENRYYTSKYPHRYRAKNAPFDTIDELYQVDGVSDLFMAAFRDRLTVFPDKNRLLNINTNDPIQQYLNVVTVAANENDPKLNPYGLVYQSIQQEIAYTKLFSFFGMSVAQFVGIVERNGIAIKPDIKSNVAQNRWVTDKSETFTIKAVGQAGDVEKTVTAVVRYDDALGKLLYYREE